MIPEQTLLNFPVFGDNATKVEPDNNKKSNGWQQGDVVPAEWMNWEWYHASKGVADLNKGVNSMEKEMNSVLSAAGISPSEATNNQLLTSIFKLVYPVGSLYWTSKAPNDGGDPNSLFGGVWVQIKNAFVYAKGDNDTVDPIRATPHGSKTHTITSNELPTHTHTQNGTFTTESQSTTTTSSSRKTDDSGWKASTDSMNRNSTGSFYYMQTGSTAYASGNVQVGSRTGGIGVGGGDYGTEFVIDVSHEHNMEHIHGMEHTHTTTISGETGNGGFANNAMSIMPPHLIKYCWERTA